MKKIPFFIFLMSLIFQGLAQSNELEGTTLEEFNYITKGYPNLKKMGLDEKSGYSMVLISDFVSSDKTFSFHKLMKDGEELPRAIYIKYGSSYHYCLPNPNTSDPLIWGKYVSDITGMASSTKSAYIFSLSRLIMYCWSDYEIEYGLEGGTK